VGVKFDVLYVAFLNCGDGDGGDDVYLNGYYCRGES